MDGKNWQTNIVAFRAFIAREHLSITGEREIPSGYQFIVTDGISKTSVSFYTTGKVLIQGASVSTMSFQLTPKPITNYITILVT
jgi:hypothetical protein